MKPDTTHYVFSSPLGRLWLHMYWIRKKRYTIPSSKIFRNHLFNVPRTETISDLNTGRDESFGQVFLLYSSVVRRINKNTFAKPLADTRHSESKIIIWTGVSELVASAHSICVNYYKIIKYSLVIKSLLSVYA